MGDGVYESTCISPRQARHKASTQQEVNIYSGRLGLLSGGLSLAGVPAVRGRTCVTGCGSATASCGARCGCGASGRLGFCCGGLSLAGVPAVRGRTCATGCNCATASRGARCGCGTSGRLGFCRGGLSLAGVPAVRGRTCATGCNCAAGRGSRLRSSLSRARSPGHRRSKDRALRFHCAWCSSRRRV